MCIRDSSYTKSPNTDISGSSGLCVEIISDFGAPHSVPLRRFFNSWFTSTSMVGHSTGNPSHLHTGRQVVCKQDKHWMTRQWRGYGNLPYHWPGGVVAEGGRKAVGFGGNSEENPFTFKPRSCKHVGTRKIKSSFDIITYGLNFIRQLQYPH